MSRRSIAKAEGAQEPDKRPQVKRRRSRKVTRPMTDGIVNLLNLPLSLFAADWALEEHEIVALSASLCDLAAANPYVAQLIINLANARGWGSFPAAVGAIVVKRLAKAGRLPELAAMPADAVLYAMAGADGQAAAAMEVVQKAATEPESGGA